MTAARAGSAAAESEIVRRYRPTLTSYCSQIAGPDLAEDAVNQALLQALIALRRDDRPTALRPWLFRIARNCAIDVTRTKPAHAEIEDQACTTIGPPARIEQRETMRSIVGGLGRLAPHERRAFVAREFEGSSYVDIADELGYSTGAVRQMIFRARQHLRQGAAALLPLLRLPRPGGAEMLSTLGTCATTAVLASAGAMAPARPAIAPGHVTAAAVPTIADVAARSTPRVSAGGRRHAAEHSRDDGGVADVAHPASPPSPAPAAATAPPQMASIASSPAFEPGATDAADVISPPTTGGQKGAGDGPASGPGKGAGDGPASGPGKGHRDDPKPSKALGHGNASERRTGNAEPEPSARASAAHQRQADDSGTPRAPTPANPAAAAAITSARARHSSSVTGTASGPATAPAPPVAAVVSDVVSAPRGLGRSNNDAEVLALRRPCGRPCGA